MPEYREYPKAIYKDGNPDKESMSVGNEAEEQEAAASGFFALGKAIPEPATEPEETHEELQQTEEAAAEEEVIEAEAIPTEPEAEAEPEADDEKAALRAAYLEKFGAPAPGRMGISKLKEVLA